MRILIIENERSIQRGLSLSLQKLNYQVYSAESLLEGYYLNQVQDIDLIILEADLLRPRYMDSSDFRGKPLLILYDENQDYLKSYMKNGLRTLQKPFSLSLFKEVVGDILEQKVCELSA
jgi:DNA-binding response OmpR family regulator